MSRSNIFRKLRRAIRIADFCEQNSALVPAMRDDLHALTPPTADNHTAADVALDFTNLRDYLASRAPDTLRRGLSNRPTSPNTGSK